jgi:hypothetical protein
LSTPILSSKGYEGSVGDIEIDITKLSRGMKKRFEAKIVEPNRGDMNSPSLVYVPVFVDWIVISL